MSRFHAAGVGLVVAVSCARAPSRNDTLNLALKTSPNRLDPALVVDVAEGELCALMFQGLVRFSPAGSLVPDLARSWTVSRDGKRYVFRLDTRMRFANGRPVRADDVAYSFERLLAPGSASSRRWVFDHVVGAAAFGRGETQVIEGVRARDDSTLSVELTAPFKPFLSMLALPAAMVVARESVGENELPVGSGRWRLAAWERGDYVSLEPNPYHPRPPRHLRQIRFRIIPEAFTRIAEFESGGLDILEIPQAEVSRFLDDERYEGRIQARSELRVFYVGLNNTRGPLRDPRVRRALNMAVDVDQLIRVLTSGHAVRAAGAIPPGLPGHRDRRPYPFDPPAARRLLAEAGYPDGFEMEIWQRESPEGNRVLEAIQGYLTQVGVEVRLVRREWSAFKEAVSAGKVDAFLLDWFADYPDAENFLFPLFDSHNKGGGGNRAFFEDATVDSLIDLASATLGERENTELYARVDSLVYSQAPWIYLWFPRTFHVVSDRVSGYRLPTLYLGADYTGVAKGRRK
jgi:ABC-type transport system substrate-binding protein